MKRSMIVLILFLAYYNLSAQQDILPRGFAEGEEEKMSQYISQRHIRSTDCEPLPFGISLRSIAEWEELQAIIISWDGFDSILTEIVINAKEECNVIIVCEDESIIKIILDQAGVDYSTGITFIEDDFNSIWVRDYGPNTVYLDDVGTLGLVDWIYNRPRPADDKVSNAVAEVLDIPLYCTDIAPEDLVHTGGNYMADGLGGGFSSELVIEENDDSNQWGTSNHTTEEIDQIMQDYMGITSYTKMKVLPYDAIHHIDMHMKLLDEETLLIGQYPEGVADGPQIEENIEYILKNYKTPFGNDYKVIRMPMPPSANGSYPDSWGANYRTYTNSIIINKTILVPIYETKYDTTALRIWNESMPGYNIVGIDCNNIIPLSGAIHCITKEIGVNEPLLISHEKVTKMCINEPVEIRASIKHISGIESANLFYKSDVNSIEWIESEMVKDGESDDWILDLPVQEQVGTIKYFINAVANSGKVMNRPMVAPAGHWTIEVSDCTMTSSNDLENELLSVAIFPNPSHDLTTITINNKTSGHIQLSILDFQGQKLENIYKGKVETGRKSYVIDVSNYPRGTYHIEVMKEGSKISMPIIVN